MRAEVGRERLAGPAQHDAAVVDRAADDPAPRRQRVAEHAARRGSTAGRSTISRSAPLVPIEQAATPGCTAPTPRLASGPSAAPTITGSPASRPELGGGRRAEREAARWSGTSGDSRVGVDARDGERLAVPVERRCRFSSPVPDAIEWSTAHAPVSRADHELLDPRPAPRGGERRGLVLGEPQELGQRRHRMQRRAGAVVQLGVLGAQALGLLGRAHVGPRDQRRRAPARRASRPDERVHRPAERQRLDPRALVAGGGSPRRGSRPSVPSTTAPGPARPGRARARAAGSPPRRGPARGRRRRRRPPWRWSSRCRRRGRRSPGRSRREACQSKGLRVSRRRTAGADGWRARAVGVQSLEDRSLEGSSDAGRDGDLRARGFAEPRARPAPSGYAPALAEIRDELRAQRAEARRIHSAFAFFAALALIIALANLVAVAVKLDGTSSNTVSVAAPVAAAPAPAARPGARQRRHAQRVQRRAEARRRSRPAR